MAINANITSEARPAFAESVQIAQTKAKSSDNARDAEVAHCTRWERARAEAILYWARAAEDGAHDAPFVQDDGHTLEVALEEMRECERWLASTTPVTIRAAMEMLKMALAILDVRAREPDSLLASGPAEAVIQNVITGFNYTVDGPIPDYRVRAACTCESTAQ